MVYLGARVQGCGLCLEQVLLLRRSIVQVCKELHRFEKLMEYFRNEDSNIDFMVRNWAWAQQGGVLLRTGASLTVDFGLCRT